VKRPEIVEKATTARELIDAEVANFHAAFDELYGR
jgi:hypothetical protein